MLYPQVYLYHHLSYISRVCFCHLFSSGLSSFALFFCPLLFCISLSVGVSVITIFIFVSILIEQNVN